MRPAAMLLASLLAPIIPVPAFGQHSVDRPWQIRVATGWQQYNGAARDSSTGVDIEIRPSNSVGFEIGLAHRGASWEGRLDLGYASGRFLGESDDVAIEDKTTQSTRLRGALTLAHRLATFDGNRLQIEAGPTLDYWDTETVSSRVSLGVRAGVALLVSLGGMVLENNISFGVSASPFKQSDAPAGSTTRTLTTFTVGAGLRVPL